MPRRNYQWTRYWQRRDNQVSFGRDGLLRLWRSSLFQSSDPSNPQQFVEISSLLDIPCLILLGEPGMGKSFALKDTYLQLSDNNDAGDIFALHNMADYETSDELVEEIFENEQFGSWQQGNAIYHLFLDSLDEARIHIRTVTNKLTKSFQNNSQHLARLRVFIACRTSDWQLDFEESLKNLWGENQVAAYVLAPLQEQDVIEAASQIPDIEDANLFWQEVVRKEATPFAARPITLDFLLDEFVASGQLPQTRKELYERGCKKLCAEFNRPHADKDKLEPEERFIIAARIAATMIFTGYSSVRFEPLTENTSNSLSIEDISGEREIISGLEVSIHESGVRETLGTALFRGGEVKEWAHQTYAEFLAAWYVSQILSIAQIKSLIFHPDGKLVPQLHETSAWIASLKTELFDFILESDPDVLLQSDVATGDEQAKEKLARGLLEYIDKNPHSFFDGKNLTALKCQNLAIILREFIQDVAKSQRSRRLGLDIAIVCHETSLQELMVEIALNPEEPLRIRIGAAHGIVEIGDDNIKQQLKPLAVLDLENREFGELKISGILATWPNHLTAEELFATLIIPTEDHLIDRYVAQNWSEIILSKIESSDLPIALDWLQHQDTRRLLPSAFIDLINNILFVAWNNIEASGVATAFCLAAISLWQQHDSLIPRQGFRGNPRNNPNVLTIELILNDADKRNFFLQNLIPIISRYENMAHKLIHDVPFLNFDDVQWLISYFNRREAKQEKEFIVELLHYLVRLNEPDQFQYIYEVGQENQALWDALSFTLFIEINSEGARQLKERHLRRLEREREHEKYVRQQERLPITPSPKERVLSYLDQFERGDNDAWWKMSYWMMVRPNGMLMREYESEYDIGDLPVWDELTDFQKPRIVSSSINFLHTYFPDRGNCNNSWWENPELIYYGIVAGCRALFLAIDHEQSNSLTETDWKKWAPAMTYYIYRSLLGSDEEQKRRRKIALLKMAKTVAPEEVNETLLWIAERENDRETFFFTSKIEPFWDEQLAILFLRPLEEEKFKFDNETQILRAICRYNFSLVYPLLKSWLPNPLPMEERPKQRAVIAAQLLFSFAEDAGWDLVWPAIQSDTDFGKKIIECVSSVDSVAGRIPSGFIANKINEVSIADLYIWSFNQYPPEYDPPQRSGVNIVTLEHEVAGFRDSLPSSLARRGTKESIQELKRIADFLDLDLSQYQAQANVNYLQNSWQPIAPNEFRELRRNRRSRWIQTESQLLDAVNECLEQLNLEFQGKTVATPTAIDLWNEYKRPVDGKRTTFRTPKDEERLSDYIERFMRQKLEGRGVFISRENQIRRGSFTDIYIETMPLLPNGTFGQSIAVIIEVKGCWHKDLKTAMASQLKDRYMAENNIYHSIYLVGWFLCDSWEATDLKSRWNSGAKDFEELQNHLSNQATELSIDGFEIRPYILDITL